VSVDNIFSVESAALPSYEEIKKLPNKVLLWCGGLVESLFTYPHFSVIVSI